MGESLDRSSSTPAGPRISVGRLGRRGWWALGLAVVALLGTANPGAAQEVLPGPWAGVAVGSGFRLDDPQGFLSDQFGVAGHARLGYGLENGWSLGVEYSRVRLASSVTTLNRQTVSAVVFLPRGPDGTAHLKLGAGMGISTRVDIDEPPEGLPGDRLVAIGDESGLGATAGFSFRVPVRSWAAINPGLDLYVQRLDGLTTANLVASVGVVFGRHRDPGGRN